MAGLMRFAVGLTAYCFFAASPQAPTCWKTDLGEKCGTDTILSSGSCGPTTPCVFLEEVYEQQRTCVSIQVGKDGCSDRDCMRRTIERVCDGVNCVFDHDHYDPIVDGTEAAGSFCWHP